MSNSASDRSQHEQQLDALIAEYYGAAEQGRPLDQAEFLKQHPEFSAELREFFADVGQIEKVAQPLSPALDETQPLSGSSPTARGSGTLVRYFGDYEILEELGVGGMGVVFKARQTKLNKIIALKMIKVGHLASEDQVRRFQAEARAAAKLDHPGIVPVHEVGVDQGQHYYTMDYVGSGSLSKLHRDEPVASRRAAELVKQLAEAMHYAHGQGIVHRDLKPANVLLTTGGVPRITDFGLAKRLWSDDESAGVSMTETGQILGTAGYMSPEQAAGKTRLVGPPADIYSLGAVLYALLTSRAPFVGESQADTILQVIQREPVSPRVLNPSIARDLETICLKCLEKEPHKRYGTAQLLADDLGRFLEGRPVIARPVSGLERGWRWCRRNPSAALALVLLATFSIVSPPVAYREFQQTRELGEKNVELREKTASIASLLETETGLRKTAEGDAKQIQELLTTKEVALEQVTKSEREATLAREEAEQREQEALQAGARERRRRFASDIGLIAFHWDLGNLNETQRLLDEQEPRGKEEDLREFTWRHWSHVLKSQHPAAPIKMPTGMQRPVFSKDGLRIAFTTAPKGPIHVRRVDAAPGAPDEFLLPNAGQIGRLAFVEDSNTLAVFTDFAIFANQAGSVTLWDLTSSPAQATKPIAGAFPSWGPFSSIGRFVVSRLDQAGTVCRVWDLVKKVSVADLPLKVNGRESIHVNSEGTRLVTGSGRVWNILEQREEFSLPVGHDCEASFAPNGEDILSVGITVNSRRLSLWNKQGQERVLAENATLLALSVSRNEVCWRTPRGVHLLSFAEQAVERVIRGKGIYGVHYSSGDKELAGLARGDLYRWPLDLASANHFQLLEGWNAAGQHQRSARGTYYVNCIGTQVSLWETASGRLVNQFDAVGERTGNSLHDSNAEVRSCSISDNGLFVTCSSQGTALVWNAVTGDLVETLRQSYEPASVGEWIKYGLWNVAASEDGNVVAASRTDGNVVIWHREKKSTRVLATKSRGVVAPLKLSSDGRLLGTLPWGMDGTVKTWTTWDISTLKPHPGPALDESLSSFFLRDRRVRAERDADDIIWLRDLQTGERFQRLGPHAGMINVTATPDGKNIATLSSDGSLIVWDARQSTPLLFVDGGPGADTSMARTLAFLDEGKTLALLLANGKIRHWRTDEP